MDESDLGEAKYIPPPSEVPPLVSHFMNKQPKIVPREE
jgi:hypothetical protein